MPQMQHLFEGGIHLKIVLINYGIIIFHINIFWFWLLGHNTYSGAALSNFLLPNTALDRQQRLFE